MNANMTSMDRAKAISDAFGGTKPIQAGRPGGYTYIMTPSGRLIMVRAQDGNKRYQDNGPYLKLDIPETNKSLSFNGEDDNPDFTHFYLGNDGEQNDIPLQIALVGTLRYLYG